MMLLTLLQTITERQLKEVINMDFNNESYDVNDLIEAGLDVEEYYTPNLDSYHGSAVAYEEEPSLITNKIRKALSDGRYYAEVLDAYENDPSSDLCKGVNIEEMRKKFDKVIDILNS